MVELFANSGDPDQTPCSAASDLGLHCLPVTGLGVSSLQWVNKFIGFNVLVVRVIKWLWYIQRRALTGVCPIALHIDFRLHLVDFSPS